MKFSVLPQPVGSLKLMLICLFVCWSFGGFLLFVLFDFCLFICLFCLFGFFWEGGGGLFGGCTSTIQGRELC